jgi:hypothetical protein
MTTFRRFVWIEILVVLVAFFLLYRYFHRQPDEFESFRQIQNLTPKQLGDRCGAPAQDNNGVVTAGDGIRDLHYRDTDANEIFFRFIAGDGGEWDSLGAWGEVRGPNELGQPLGPAETVRRLSCSVDSSSSAGMFFPRILKGRGASLPAALAVLFLIEPGPQEQIPHPVPPVELPRPTIPTPQLQPPNLSPTPHLGPTPQLSPTTPYSNPSPSPEPDSGPGPGGGSGSETPHAWSPIAVPCPSDVPDCQFVSYYNFVALMSRLIDAEKRKDFDGALGALVDLSNKVVQMPLDAFNRGEQIKSIYIMEMTALNLAVVQMQENVKKLEPFQSDSAEVKKQKMEQVMRDDRETRQLWKSGAEANRDSTVNSSATDSSSGSIHFESEAHRQALHIDATGSGFD